MTQLSTIQAQNFSMSQQQIDILKDTICKGVSNTEFEIFLMACKKTGLDPFMKQIHAVKRKARKPDGTWGETMTIQTGIDGYRLIAERTGCYAPGPEPTFTYDNEGHVESATAYIKKMTKDGTWHTVSASAYMDEYCQKGREGGAIGLWGSMPRTMLSKCAEAICLRKAFPSEMSGVYTQEEMSQADSHKTSLHITEDQAVELTEMLARCDADYQEFIMEHLKSKYNVFSMGELTSDLYDRIKSALVKKMGSVKEVCCEPVRE